MDPGSVQPSASLPVWPQEELVQGSGGYIGKDGRGSKFCDPNSAVGSRSEVKDFNYILFHFTSVLYNILFVLGNPKPLFDFPSYKQMA